MRVVLALCGAALILAGQLTASIGYDERAAEVRELRADGGVETTGVAVATFERERVQHSRRSSRTVTLTCGEFAYRAAGQRYTHRDYEQCDDVEIGDERALIYDADQPSRVFNNSDDHLDGLDRQSNAIWWFRVGGALLMVPLVLGIAGRVRRAAAA